MTNEDAFQQRLAALEQENRKLRKINQALIERVEAGPTATLSTAQAGANAPYAAFQHAAVLAEQVRERTAELSKAYDELRRSIRYSETLQQRERWIRTITDHVPAMIAYLSANGVYLFTNRGYDDFYGVAPGSLFNQHLEMAHGVAGAARLAPYIQHVLSGETAIFEIDEQNAQQQWRHLLKTYVPHRDDQQQIIGFFVLNRDITERKRTSEALRQANLHLEQRVLQRTEALLSLNQQLQAEIDERRAIEQQLRDATEAAQQANQSKTKFLAAVSHDVLQPLNAARLFNGALLEQALTPPQLALAQATGKAMDDVGDLLRTLVDLSKLDAGQLQPQWSLLNLGQLLADLAHECRHLATHKGVEFRTIPCQFWVRSDAAWLARILRNLLSNAVRYTPSGGRIVLGCRRQGTSVQVQVWDTGVGIAAEDIPLIFQEFHRLENAVATEAGLGLGLSIVQRFCQLLQQPLTVRSVVNQGSCFAIQLPRVAAPSEAASIAQSPLPSSQAEPAAAQCIWVLDNDPAICHAMTTLLQSWGYQVVAKTELSMLPTAVVPQLLIVDYHLAHGLTGTEAIRQLRQQTAFAEVPVLMITANSQTTLATELKQQGFQVLYKPVRPLQLRAMLRFLLSPTLTQSE